jgi:methionine-rich copper-binding protein CopC
MRNHFLPAAALALSLMLAPATALAHAKLVGSTPTANSAATKVTSVNLRFNEKLVAATVKAELVMTGMPGMADHPPMKIATTSTMGKDGKSMTLLVKRALVPGTYKVKWAAAGADAHPMKGEFGFAVK